MSYAWPAWAQQMQNTLLQQLTTAPPPTQVDFLRPTMDAMKESMNSAWRQLPPPVQQAVPYVGVALGSGLIVFAIQQHRVNVQVG